MYAIIEASGKQYRVSSGDTIKVDLLQTETGAVMDFERVLAIIDGSKTVIGTPYVKGAQVRAEVMGTSKADKVLVYKKRPRRVYEKLRGHRQPYTILQIKEISVGG